MNAATALRIAALTGFLAVALGAFGAHGLEGMLKKLPVEQAGDAVKRMDWWKTAVAYHLPHAVVLLTLALSGAVRKCSFLCMLGGIALFSGTLYAMALGAPRWLGAITPIGGTLLIVGWLLLAIQKKPAA